MIAMQVADEDGVDGRWFEPAATQPNQGRRPAIEQDVLPVPSQCDARLQTATAAKGIA